MVNTERRKWFWNWTYNYNILNIVVNTERFRWFELSKSNYNILNIVVNTELLIFNLINIIYYNILLTFYEQILLRRTTADQTWLICRADEIHGMRRENSDAKNWRGADGDGKKKNKEGLAGILDYPWGAGGGDFYF